MRLLVLLVGVISTLTGCSVGAERCARIAPERSEIVVAADAPRAVKFAAQELNGMLERVFGRSLPVVDTPTAGRSGIFLGDSEWSRGAGVDVAGLPRDAFTIKAEDGRVFIAGHDDPEDPLDHLVAVGRTANREHATLFGVYEFLERFAGVRFYFPGELGTITPRAGEIRVPEGTFTEAPVSTVRDIYQWEDGALPEGIDAGLQKSWRALEWLRMRQQTECVPCAHGQRGFRFPDRFHATHPEYFALVRDDHGNLKRNNPAVQKGDVSAQMCHTSGIWDEIYRDCRAYLSGKPAKSRGILRLRSKDEYGWNVNCSGRFVDVMPEDSMHRCLCENCQKAYGTNGQFATELIWGNTAKLARRLSADGFKDAIVTQMAYPPYRDVPTCDLPDNVWVMVAEMGPWGTVCPGKTESEIEEVRRWVEKIGHKVWMWTYPSKFGERRLPGVPDMAPRAWADYYRRLAPYSYGAFCEAEGEKAIFHYLNYYMFSKVAWNPSVDTESILKEHFRLMFGAAAPEMARFYAELEEKWLKGALSRWRRTKTEGMDFVVATDIAIWREAYSKAVREEWGLLFDRAAEKVKDDPDSARRLAFIRREFLDHLNKVAARFEKESDPERARARYRAMDPRKNLFPKMDGPRHLVATNGEPVSVGFALDGKLKPGAKYRMSAVFRYKDVVSLDGGTRSGCWMGGYAGDWRWYPDPFYTGTTDWVYREYVFTMPDSPTDPRQKPELHFQLSRASGEAWVDCLALEAVE